MRAAAEQRPWESRKKEIFWTGGDTNEQRNIVANSEIMRTSGLTDIHMMSWGDNPDLFRERFSSLAEHCDYRFSLAPQTLKVTLCKLGCCPEGLLDRLKLLQAICYSCVCTFVKGPFMCRSLLHLSGVAYSARLKFLMLCGSPVVFPHRGYWEFQEFWFHMLKDRENIILTGGHMFTQLLPLQIQSIIIFLPIT